MPFFFTVIRKPEGGVAAAGSDVEEGVGLHTPRLHPGDELTFYEAAGSGEEQIYQPELGGRS